MTRKSICLLFLVLLALPCFAASKYESKITSLEGEKWWGGAVGLGSKMPFEGDLRLFDLSAENLNNQNVPLLLSSEGRYIWSDKPFSFQVENGELRLYSDYEKMEPVLAGRTLKDAYMAASAKHFPPSGDLPDPLFFSMPQYNTWIELMYNQNQEDILTFINAYKDICNFAEIVPVSALKDKNTDLMLDLIYKYLPCGPQYYDEDTVTDQPMRQIAAELIREKALRLLSDEIPHGIAVTIEKMTERKNGMMDIEATIICERDSHKGIIIGKGGAMLKRIGSAARREIEDLMDTQVNLQIWVKVRKEWRDSELYMKNYGYNEKEI